jgi:alkanesulfonate monooxygenase SsuD/methylene tetrahydromethanopterin reductase-like flavin-dependent oxidoreductase (luciferase family)
VTVPLQLGLALPSFVDDPSIPIAVAKRADEVGIDGVFVYDHLWRDVPPPRRGALECFTLLGAVAAETERVRVGALVARATLRPPAVLAHGFDTVQRVSGGRLVAGIGAGDSQTRDENEAFGLPFGTLVTRVEALLAAVDASRGRGYPVWVAGHIAAVREIVARADAWNTWGGTPERFAADAALVREVAPHAMTTWGGLALLGRDDDNAAEKQRGRSLSADVVAGGPERVARRLRAFAAHGAEWAIVAPIDASDPANAEHLAEVAARLERAPAASVPAVEEE